MATQLTGRVFSAFRRWRQRRAAIQELSALTDRMLCDMGVERRDIRRVVDGLLNAKGQAESWHPHVHEVLPPVGSRGRLQLLEASGRGTCDAA